MDLKRILNLKHNDIIGLDIGSYSVKLISLGYGNAGYHIKAVGIAEIVHNTENDLDYTSAADKSNNKKIVEAIRDCFAIARLRAKAKLRTNLAVCGVSGSEVAVRDFSFPLLPEEEIDSATKLEAEVVCPFNAEQASIDYQVFSNSEKKTKGIFVAATNTLISNKKQYTKEAGLKCVIMDVDGLALLNCFNNFTGVQDKETAVILNVGYTYTTLAVMSNDGRPFIRDTAFAGNNIITQIAAINNCSTEDVKQILFDNSQNSQDFHVELGNSLEKASEELITDVSETLRFYAAQEKSVPIKKIYVCGGFALADGFIEILSRRFGIEVVLWNPFDNITGEISKGSREILKTAGPSLAVAAGLALRVI